MVYKKILDCLQISFLFTLIVAGWMIGDNLGVKLKMSNFLIMPWAFSFMGLIIGDVITRLNWQKIIKFRKIV